MKQVKTGPSQAPVAPNSTSQNNLFISVDTFDADGKTIGGRIVDMYHFGTRNWLQNHHWWAMHNGHTVECNVAKPEQIENYLASAKLALAEKFNGASTTVTPAAAAEPVVEPEPVVAAKAPKAAAA